MTEIWAFVKVALTLFETFYKLPKGIRHDYLLSILEGAHSWHDELMLAIEKAKDDKDPATIARLLSARSRKLSDWN